MTKQKSDLIDDIKKDLIKYSSNVSRFAAITTREVLYRVTENAIDKFYADYTPGDYHDRKANYAYENPDYAEEIGYIFTEANSVYQRTYNLYNSYKKYYKNNHDSTFSGGVILSPDYMRNVYRGSRELVFDLAYAGFHGLNSWEPDSPRPAIPYGVTTPSPMDVINNKADGLANHPNDVLDLAIQRADGEPYAYLSRSSGRPRKNWEPLYSKL